MYQIEKHIHNLYTEIPKCDVDDLFSEEAYSTEGYLSPESFTLQSFMPLGGGSFGTVYHARGPVGNGSIAVKVIPKGETTEDEDLVKNEITIQSGLPFHENLLQLHSYFAEKECICLVLEYASGGSLLQDRPLSAAKYIREVCSGLGHMHEHRIIHRDVKSENLVLGSDGRVKIIDFGVAKGVDEHENTLCGSPYYQAPEMIRLSQRYDHKIDIWAIGVLLYEFHYTIEVKHTTNTMPFRGNSKDELKEAILKGKIFWPDEGVFSDSARDLISKILVRDRKKRYSLDEILKHSFIEATEGGSGLDDDEVDDNYDDEGEWV
jgi:serine/threonine protein kinase